MKLWLKKSAFADGVYMKNKSRPLASYAGHLLRKSLSVTCRCINYMLNIVSHNSASVNSSAGVLKRLHKFNNSLDQHRRGGYSLAPFVAKHDVDIFSVTLAIARSSQHGVG